MELSAFKEMATRSSDLKEFDEQCLKSPSFMNIKADRVADCIIGILDNREEYRGTAAQHGSFSRGTNLRGRALSDIDILCYIREDYVGNELSSLEDFQTVRDEASEMIVEYLQDQLPYHFDDVELVAHWAGLCSKFHAKDHKDVRPWKIDVIFAFERLDYDYEETINELYEMHRSDALINISELSHWQNEFVQNLYDQCEELKTLVRLLKYFNKMVGKCSPAKGVNSFVFEAMVAILWHNGTIPYKFNMRRALCTCIEYIGYPDDIWAHCSPPTKDGLKNMRRSCGNLGLIIVAPMAPFHNIAARTKNTNTAWKILTQKAQQVLNYLQAKGVMPY